MPIKIDKKTVKRLTKWAKKNRIDFPTTEEELGENEKIDLKLYKLQELPKEICILTHLTELDLSFNELSELPKEFSQLQNLEILILNRNKFEEFPESIFKLKNLKHLEIGSNQLKQIPEKIDEFENLEILSLNINFIQHIPDTIGNLKNLKKLDLSANQIQYLPPEIGNLENLESLMVWANKLTDLPKEMGKLINLTELKIWSNKINRIPQAILELPKLKEVDLMIGIEKINEKLVEASQSDNTLLAQVLINCGADTNYKWKDYGGNEFTTPLFEAHSVAMIELLIKNNADPFLTRKKKVERNIKVWESDKEIETEESFISMKHSLEISKYKKTIDVDKDNNEAPN